MDNLSRKPERQSLCLRLSFLFQSTISKYIFAVSVVFLAVLLRDALDPLLTENQLVLSFFYIAVLATSWFGELKPAIFCSILGFIATDWFFLYPRYSLEIEKPFLLINVVSYFSVTLPIILFGYLMRKNQQAQKEEKDILQTVMNASGEFHLVYLDRNFNFVRVNNTYASACGYRPEEMIGKNHFALYPHEENERIFRRVRDTGIPAAFHDKPFVFPDHPEKGVTYWDWSLVPVKDEKERVKGLVFSLLETTERKRAEEKLRKSEELYHSLFDNMLNGFAYCKMLFEGERPSDFIYISVNRSFESLTGLKNVVGRKVSEVIPGIQKSDADLLEIYGRVALTGKAERFERYVEAMKMWLSISVYSIQKGYFVAVFDVITERKRGEKELLESRKDLQRAQAVGHIGNWRFDVQRNELRWSDEAYRIFGIALGTPLTYQTFLSSVHPGDREFVDEKWKAAMAGADYDIEHRIIAAGKVKWVREKAYLEFDKEGTLRAGFGIVQDITERRRAEEILKRDKEELEEIVGQRTAKLLKTERALDRAKRLSDIGALASTVAHELRNPLAAITMATHNIKKQVDDLPVKKHLMTIGKKVGESEQIINNLLFYSRLRQPHFESVKMLGVVNETFQLVKTLLSKNIELKVDADALKDVIVEADPLQIKEVLSNVLNNAIDAVRDREQGRIEVNVSEDNEKVCIRIKDNGVGMSKEVMLSAMEPFYSTKSKGTGLGLAVSKQIIDLHNGTIKLESWLDKGTEVTICLPKKRGGSKI